MSAAVSGLRPNRRTLLVKWLADLLISTLVPMLFAVPILFERYERKNDIVESVDVWQFDSTPTSDSGLRDWGAYREDLRSFHVDVVSKNQRVLRYRCNKSHRIAAPDWRALGYVNPRLVSTDTLPVQDIQDIDAPRSGLGWLYVLAGSIAALAALFPRVNRAWNPAAPWKMPLARSWHVVVVALLGTMVLDAAGRWLLQRDGSVVASPESVIRQLHGWAWWMAWCSVAIVGPALEEALFRGCLFGRFRMYGYVASGAVLSALAFSIAHGTPVLMPKYFCNGLILAWACHRTGSLWPPFAVHAGCNILTLER